VVNVNLSSEELTVLGGPSEISLDLDFGPPGDRGSLTFYGLGKPDSPTVVLPEIPRVYDSYINLLTSDDEYLFVYQYIAGAGGSPVWTKLFKLVPNTYSENESQIFNASGEATIVLPIDKILPLNEIQNNFENYRTESFSVQCNLISPDPVSFGVTISDLDTNPIDGKTSLFINIKAIEYVDDAWSPVVGTKTVHLFITVV
jgi:hypothetical protein